MRLTPSHLERVAMPVADPGPVQDRRYATEDDYAAVVARLLADRPADGAVWIFAYGSLIWNPVHDVAERRVALLRGWHRSFCLGWDTHFRGMPGRPGLMMVLDRGGACRGVIERLPDGRAEDNLFRLFRREMFLLPTPMPPRWVTVRTAAGECVRAITFAIDRDSGRYVGGLDADRVADMLATAVGHWGTMAEYLHNTVAHLEAEGIHDRRLWRLQEMVAARIEAAHGPIG
ncbi:MAG: gamma-glutamylcyclotransferase [Alphaproteobacteria bacterium]